MNRTRAQHYGNFITAGILLTTFLGSGLATHGQDSAVDKLEQENQQLKQRLDALEDLLKKEGIQPSENSTTMPVKALSGITISGFVTSSFFYDIASTKDSHPVGYLWNTALNQFTLNKVKLTLASPAVDKDKWDAAYRVSLMYGQDAKVDNSSSGTVGYQAIREAYVELNAPIGTGLDFKAGELISLLNYESGDGGAVNANFSQGYQWWYTGNGPAGGVQLGYDFNDMFGIKLRLQNGLYTGETDSGSKTFMGGFYVNPDKKTSLAFLGFAGRQDFTPSWYLSGGSFIGSRVLTEKYNITFATEADYFHFSGFDSALDGVPGGGANHGDFWSLGGWLTADLASSVTLALRADVIDDPTGFGTFWNSPSPSSVEYAGAPGFPSSVYTTGAGQDLTSVTLTLDYKPVASLKIQPEIRWNHSSYASAFSPGKKDQVIIGMGASYIF
jgi:hypothetical protein